MFAFRKVFVDIIFVIKDLLVYSSRFRFLPKQEFEKNNNPKENVNTIPFLKLFPTELSWKCFYI